jgi:hypothetical protein
VIWVLLGSVTDADVDADVDADADADDDVDDFDVDVLISRFDFCFHICSYHHYLPVFILTNIN